MQSFKRDDRPIEVRTDLSNRRRRVLEPAMKDWTRQKAIASIAASRMPPILSLLVLILLCPSGLGAIEMPEEQVREAAEKAVTLLQQSSRRFYEVQTCNSCHHGPLPFLTFRRAREHGVSVDEPAARDLARKIFAESEHAVSLDLTIQGVRRQGGIDGALTLVAAHDAGFEPTLINAVEAMRLAHEQEPDGHWRPEDFRPPSSSSEFTATAFMVKAVDLFLPDRLGVVKRRVIGRARQWFEINEGITTEDLTFRLFGLRWSSADRETVKAATNQLKAQQRPDGGWAQILSRSTDAYATAEVLVALHEAGDVPTTDPAWQDGLRYLIESQKPDGSWLVETRLVSPKRISPPYFESGFPHGKHQFISATATNWAVMALSAALPREQKPAKPLAVPEVAERMGTPPAWLETALFGAADELQALLDDGLDANSATAEGTTLLMAAATDPEKARLLIERGADVNATAATGFSALYVAATHRGSSPVLRLLLAHGAKILPPRGVMFNAFPAALAALAGDGENVALLREAGDDLSNTMLFNGTASITLSRLAAGDDRPEIIYEVLGEELKIDPTRADSLLISAVVRNQLGAAERLIRLGANINFADEHGYTPALYAATVDPGDTAMLELLIRQGADLSIVAKDGQTALSNARRFGHTQLVEVLEAAIGE